jgi:hypothetical protein
MSTASKKRSIHKITAGECRAKDIPYTTIITDVARSIKNAEAAGVWLYLMGHGETWIIQKQDIKNQFGFSIRKVENIYRYLQSLGLMACVPVKNNVGKFIKHTWEAYGLPKNYLSYPQDHSVDFRHTGEKP